MIFLYTARYTFNPLINGENEESFSFRDLTSFSRTNSRSYTEMSISKTENHSIACSWAYLNVGFNWYSISS